MAAKKSTAKKPTAKKPTAKEVEKVAKLAIQKINKAEKEEKEGKKEAEKAKAQVKKAENKVKRAKKDKNKAITEAVKATRVFKAKKIKVKEADLVTDTNLITLNELVAWMVSIQEFGIEYISRETLRRYIDKVGIGDQCAERVGDAKIKKQWRVKRKCFVNAIRQHLKSGKCKTTRGAKGIKRLRCSSK